MNIAQEPNGIIFNIQRYSIHDGPGIRTTVFLKGCPLKCFWCHNPESQNRKPEIFYFRDKCASCGQCVPACPNGAIARSADGVMTFDREKCAGCGACAGVCPNEARTLTGRPISVDEIMAVVLKDKKFYDKSGGGVTVSGGEPAAQPGFALAILRRCREAGIHTNLDTCGYAPWEVYRQLLDYVDLVYYDIKCIDPEKHLAATGVSNEQILSNAIQIARMRPMRVRVPVIPHFNDDAEEIEKIALFAKEKLGCRDIDLLTYNKLCESKYERLDRPFLGETNTESDERVEQLMASLRDVVDAQF